VARSASPARRAALAALVCLACAAGTPPHEGIAAAVGSPEQRYVDEDDAKAAEAMLAKLLPKYDTPAKCAELSKLLRGKRSYPPNLEASDTLAFLCSDGKSRQFTYVRPKRVPPNKPAGVLIFLHGAVRQPAPGGGANEARLFGPAVESLGLIVVGPSTYEGVEWGSAACRGLVHHSLDFVKRSFPVDENRVYLAGDSDGGRGTYALAETEATFLAAAVPVIGSPGGVTRFANLRNLPWFAINGETDGTFKIDGVRAAVEGMKQAGIDLQWKLVEGQGHDPYFFTKFKDEVVAFLGKRVRDPYPKRVDWQMDPSAEGGAGGFPGDTMRWLRIDRTGTAESNATFDDAGQGSLRSDIPRARATWQGNAVKVETSGVQAFTVLVSDQMFDLAKDVEITTNGRVSWRGKPVPDAKVLLEEARRFRDRSLVFSARVTVEVDAAPPPEGGGK
jgi:pimeloyl-ACP methyl ester carboxylesterase